MSRALILNGADERLELRQCFRRAGEIGKQAPVAAHVAAKIGMEVRSRAAALPSDVDGDLIRRQRSVARLRAVEPALTSRPNGCQAIPKRCKLVPRDLERAQTVDGGESSPFEACRSIGQNRQDIGRAGPKTGASFVANGLASICRARSRGRGGNACPRNRRCNRQPCRFAHLVLIPI